jgi:hypothetical protein
MRNWDKHLKNQARVLYHCNDLPSQRETAPAGDRGGADKHDDIEARLTYHRHVGSTRHAEIALRYERRAKNRTPTTPDRLTIVTRARELRRFLEHRYGEALPDDDAGRDDLALLLGYVMQLNPGRGVPAMIAEARTWAPWLAYYEARDLAERIAASRPTKLKADTIAERIGCTYVERTMLGLTTIGACDLTRAERNKATRKRRTDAERERCRKAGVKPRGRISGEQPKSDATLGSGGHQPLDVGEASAQNHDASPCHPKEPIRSTGTCVTEPSRTAWASRRCVLGAIAAA